MTIIRNILNKEVGPQIIQRIVNKELTIAELATCKSELFLTAEVRAHLDAARKEELKRNTTGFYEQSFKDEKKKKL